MDGMAGPFFKSFFRLLIICICVPDRDCDPSLYLFHKCERSRLFRRDGDISHCPAGRPLKPPKNFHTAGDDVFFILGAFFLFADKGTFHVDPQQIRALPALFAVLCSYGKDMFQHFHRQRHGRRGDGCHPDGRFVSRDRGQCAQRPIAKIIAFTAMQMDIDQPGDRITSLPV